MKKLGHYFNSGLKATVLTAAMLSTGLTFTGCPNPNPGIEQHPENGNGGNEQGGNEQGGNEQGGNEQGGNEQGGNEHGGNEQGGNEQGGEEKTEDLDENLTTYIFKRHRFANENENFALINEGKERLEHGTKRYKQACDFMAKELNELQSLIAKETHTGIISATADAINDKNRYDYSVERGYVIEDHIAKANSDYARPLAQIIYGISNVSDRSKFLACYDKLAIRAYNDSIGAARNLQGYDAMPTFTDDEPTVNQELANYGIGVNDYTTVENTMSALLDDVSFETGINKKTLIKCVDIALAKEGMWGLKDLATSGCVGEDSVYKPTGSYYELPKRTRTDFNVNIRQYYRDIVLQNNSRSIIQPQNEMMR